MINIFTLIVSVIVLYVTTVGVLYAFYSNACLKMVRDCNLFNPKKSNAPSIEVVKEIEKNILTYKGIEEKIRSHVPLQAIESNLRQWKILYNLLNILSFGLFRFIL